MTQRSADLAQTSRSVVLQAGGDSTPLFVFPGVYGGPEDFRDMASRLGAQRPVYGFHHIGAMLECEPVESMLELARLYAAEILRLRPRGPWHLFGYSSGGVTAFEVARELNAQGGQVGLVIMAECLVPGYPKPLPLPQRLKIHVENVLTASKAERSAYLRERADNVIGRIKRTLGITALDDPDTTMSEHMVEVNRVLYAAYRNYRPEPQRVSVLFLSTDAPFDWPGVVFDDPLLGWGPAFRGPIARYAIPGHHRSIFQPENIAVLTERVQRALAQVESVDVGLQPA